MLAGCARECRFPLEEFTGIQSRPIAAAGEYSIDLARSALEGALERSHHAAANIDLLISCNISRCDGPDDRFTFEPSTAIRLKHEFGLTGALCFDVANACAGLWTGIAVVRAYFDRGLARTAALVSGEYITHLLRSAQREIDTLLDPRLACLTLGDSGAAVILEATDRLDVGLARIELATFGEYSGLCTAKASTAPHGGAIMHTDSSALAAAAIELGAEQARQVFAAEGWELGSAHHIIPHQTSERSIREGARELARRFGSSEESGQVVCNVRERGNTATTSHFVALWDGILSNRICDRERVAFSVGASGLTVGTALYELDDLPERVRNGGRTSRNEDRRGRPIVSRPRLWEEPEPRLLIEATAAVEQKSESRKTALDLAAEASLLCLENAAVGVDAVSLLLFAGIYRDDFLGEPAFAALLAARLGARDRTSIPLLAFDVQNGAIGALNACDVAAKLLHGRGGERALVVAAEVDMSPPDSAQFPRRIVECGTALLLRRALPGEGGFLGFLFAERSEHVDLVRSHSIPTATGPRVQFARPPVSDDVYVATADDALAALLSAREQTSQRIESAIVGASIPGLSATVSRRLAIPPERVITPPVREGDFHTSGLISALGEARAGRPRRRGLEVIVCVGSGVQAGCALYQECA